MKLFSKKSLIFISLSTISLGVANNYYQTKDFMALENEKKATAFLNGQHGVSGKVIFSQLSEKSETTIQGKLTGLKPGLHGFHIHEFGDISSGCDTAGSHYNPLQSTHGGPQEPQRHVGDLGNLTANSEGIAEFKIVDKMVKLHGEQSVIGRTLVVHRDQDDLGKTNHQDSKTTGNSGPRLACGVIGIAK